MTTIIAIEINDAGLVVADAKELLAVEPGYAVVGPNDIATGIQAYAQARLKPSQVSNRHWANLSLDDGSTTGSGTHSSAELAFSQLEDIWRPYRDRTDAVILVVPTHYTSEQLGVLLGLAQECKVPVRAMVDAAAAASVRPYPDRQLLYVDAGLHRVSVTPLIQGDEVTAQSAESLESTGLAGLMESFARRIAEIFVLATRFDPFHEAATEQILYDELPAWLERLHSDTTTELLIPFRGDSFTVELERAQLLAAADGFYKAVLQLIAQTREGRSGLVVQLSDRLARLPGVAAALSRLDDALIVGLDPGHAAQAALLCADSLALDADQVKLYRHLPWRAQAEALVKLGPKAADATADAPRPTPTHVVYRGVAYPVNGQSLTIGRSESGERRSIVVDEDTRGVSRAHCELSVSNGELKLKDLSSHGTFVNERRIDSEQVLYPADMIRIGSPGAEFQVVIVEQENGS